MPILRLLGGGLALALSAALAAATEPSVTVKYRSAANVYLDGGRTAGLAVGDRLAVVSGRETTAELEVIFLSDLSASCRVVSESRPVRAGDIAVRVKHGNKGTEPSGATAAAPAEAAKPESTAPVLNLTTSPQRSYLRPWARVRGGIALGYYHVWDTSPSNLDFEQRTGRVDLGLWDIAGQDLTFNARLRSRQDIRARGLSLQTPKDQRQDRLYELSLRYDPPSGRFAFELGRISTSRFVGISYLDGALARVQLIPRLQLGGFFGKNVDVGGLGLEGSGQKYGGFLRLAPAGRYSFGSYEFMLAMIREFAQGDISRDYVNFEGQVGSGRRWSVLGRAQVDLNRGWRQAVAPSPYQLSNLAVSTNFRFSASSSASLSYDDYQNYRTVINRNLPEQIFSRLQRRGLRGSVYLGQPYGFNATANAGVVFKGKDPETSYSYGGGVRHGNLWGKELALSLDGAAYTNGYTNGYLASTQLGKRFTRRGHQLDLALGYSSYTLKATGQRRSSEWLRLTPRLELGHGLSLLGDLQYDQGDDTRGPRGFFELGYRF